MSSCSNSSSSITTCSSHSTEASVHIASFCSFSATCRSVITDDDDDDDDDDGGGGGGSGGDDDDDDDDDDASSVMA